MADLFILGASGHGNVHIYNFWLFLRSILDPIWRQKSTPNRSHFWSSFLDGFWTIFWPFFIIFLIIWEVKKRCEVNREAMFCKIGNRQKTLYFTVKMKGRRRRSCSKNKQKRRLDTQENHSERQSMKQAIFWSILDWFWDHFGTQNGCKIASKFKSEIDTPKSRPKVGQGGEFEIFEPSLSPGGRVKPSLAWERKEHEIALLFESSVCAVSRVLALCLNWCSVSVAALALPAAASEYAFGQPPNSRTAKESKGILSATPVLV